MYLSVTVWNLFLYHTKICTLTQPLVITGLSFPFRLYTIYFLALHHVHMYLSLVLAAVVKNLLHSVKRINNHYLFLVLSNEFPL
jgi:hypothetical protein